jgi:xanthine dehydrogenase accessory factor
MQNDLIVLIKGGGEMASGVAHRLARSHFRVCMTEIAEPQAVRRGVSFCEAVYEGVKAVEGVVARLISSPDLISDTWEKGEIPLLIDPRAETLSVLKPDVLVDAILAKRNTGTGISDGRLVIGLGPGFEAGKDVHLVIETNRGHDLGKVIFSGMAEPNTGIPGSISGYSIERVIRAPVAGRLSNIKNIGDDVESGQAVASIGEILIKSSLRGIVRGLIRDGSIVDQGMKLGDVDPRGVRSHCFTISDKARAIGGGVLEAILFKLA